MELMLYALGYHGNCQDFFGRMPYVIHGETWILYDVKNKIYFHRNRRQT